MNKQRNNFTKVYVEPISLLVLPAGIGVILSNHTFVELIWASLRAPHTTRHSHTKESVLTSLHPPSPHPSNIKPYEYVTFQALGAFPSLSESSGLLLPPGEVSIRRKWLHWADWRVLGDFWAAGTPLFLTSFWGKVQNFFCLVLLGHPLIAWFNVKLTFSTG